MDGKERGDGWINGQTVKEGRGHTQEKNGKKPGSGERPTRTVSAAVQFSTR